MVDRRDAGNWTSGKGAAGFKLSERQSDAYDTLAGFVLRPAGHVPKEGETVKCQGYVFEVLDMDGHRVDKVLVVPAT